ncbi:universal stress protein [Haloferax profundi]|uniref:Universal stress protein UspA n=1 Tax=Haloferax profundi TaxID=1544718 RepID=A0A0W1S0X7_9EURY|nr:universal stress protein [Haloferax profundi]KTG19462.1 universal stress protein UspA [Haloferax profundi]
MYLVAYDGSLLSNTALSRASALAKQTGSEILAVAVVPRDAEYAVEMGWVPTKKDFDRDAVVSELHRTAVKIAPEASFRTVSVSRLPVPGEIVAELKRVAHEENADTVFVGSENAGRVVVPLASVGGSVASDDTYDVHIVRHAPPAVKKRFPKSDFYLP